MPKNRKKVKVDNRIVTIKIPAKNRIGTRKGGISANLMSNESLMDVITDPNKSKWYHIARTVLLNRGQEIAV